MVNNNERITEDEILDLLPGYVMGILEPDELLLVDKYVHDFPHIADRVAALEESTATLAFAAPLAAPPPDAKAHILAKAGATLQTQPLTSQISDASTASGQLVLPQSNQPQPVPPNVVPSKTPPQPQRRKLSQTARPPSGFELLDAATSWWQRALGWKIATGLAGAAAIALIALTVQNQATMQKMQNELAATQQNLVELESENSELALSTEALQAEITAQQEALAAGQIAQQVQATTMLTAQRAVFLGGTDDAPQANGSLFVGENNTGTLVLGGLDPLPADQTYQLWLIPDGGNPVPAGLFAVNDDDTTSTTITLDLPTVDTGFSAVGISIEPAAGSPAPTGPIVLLGT